MLLGSVAACAGNRADGPERSAPPCVSAPFAGLAELERLSGTYRLALEATDGSRAGEGTEGNLRLLRFPEDGPELPEWATRPDVRILHYGAAELVLGEVGASANGSTRLLEPDEAGALLIAQRSGEPPAWEATIRLGSRSNRFDRPPIEGPFAALVVEEACPASFSGEWQSGGPEPGRTARGTFVAERVPAQGAEGR